MSEERVNVLAIVEAGLRAIGADGLCTYDCGCRLGDLAPCGEYFGQCVAARLVNPANPLSELRPMNRGSSESHHFFHCDRCGAGHELEHLEPCVDCERLVCHGCCHEVQSKEGHPIRFRCNACDPEPWDEPPTNPLEQIEDAMRMIQEHTGLTPERPDDERS